MLGSTIVSLSNKGLIVVKALQTLPSYSNSNGQDEKRRMSFLHAFQLVSFRRRD